MAATINTNIASINAQRNLALSGQSLNTTMQRLSSGLRVNSAKDDAAGLAIAERMNTQVKGLTVAARNANDGISLAQTAEGALGKVGDMLQRMRELAVQASNATNSDSDRVALQAEVSQLAAEIDRVAKQTNFNGQKILDGSFAGAVFQVGANSGDNVTLGALADTRSSKLSIVNYAQNTVSFDANDTPTPAIKDYAVAIPAGELKISIGSTPPQTIELDAIKPATSSLERLGQVVTAINSKSTDTGVTAYMSLDSTTGNYNINFMSSKTDAAGDPLGISFKNFTEASTGIGQPTAPAEKVFQISDIPSAAFRPAAIPTTGTLLTTTELKQGDVTKFYNALKAANDAWEADGSVGTAPTDSSKLLALKTAIDNYAADATTADNVNTALAAVTSVSDTPSVNSTTLPTTLPTDVSGLQANLEEINKTWLSNGGKAENQPFSAAKLDALSKAITAYEQKVTDGTALVASDATNINTAIAALAQSSYAPSVNTSVSHSNYLAGTTIQDVLTSLEPVVTAGVSTPATPEAFTKALKDLTDLGADTSKLDLSKYTDTLQTDGWSTSKGFTAADALAHLKELTTSELAGGLDLVTVNDVTNHRGLDNIDVTTQEGAWVALKKIDSAIDQINGARATLGAMQTRFETAVNNIDIQVENLSAARGRIVDADFAVETANLSRTQILQQAGTAMVAQANQIPQNVLQLLQG